MTCDRILKAALNYNPICQWLESECFNVLASVNHRRTWLFLGWVIGERLFLQQSARSLVAIISGNSAGSIY